MKKIFKASMMAVLGLALVTTSVATPADAASKKATVVSTTALAKTAYHGKKGYIYSSAKLTKKKYNMKNYKYTTWYGTKKATIKKSGKKASLTYITSGKKHGWIYSKYLTAGTAPINKQKRLENTIVAYNRAVMLGSSSTKYYATADLSDSYEDLGDCVIRGWEGDWAIGDTVSETSTAKTALLAAYNVFKGRFSSSQNANLAAMAKSIENTQVTANNIDDVQTALTSFSNTLGGVVKTLN
ncbi:hypothetical protein [Lactiplantibacillus daowaiensis]|uniref:D-alanyl-D-alanine carboxypeptidase n=1 Tax=Lactiplantibacillus daowaiensis TaxID=2559918 RepID=A0ABW1S3F4_9LACO